MSVTELARRIRVDVSLDGNTWTQLKGVNDLNPAITPTKQDSSDYDTDGWTSSEITMQAWSLTVKVNRKSDGGVLDPGQLMLTNCIGEFGDEARVYVRWYDRFGKAEPSRSGRAIVEQSPSKTGVADLDEEQFTFTGDGPAAKIPNPYTPTAVPAITAAAPSGAGTGDLVSITGSGFTGTTAVDFGGVAADALAVESDNLIVAAVPAGSAGAADITVTNAVGTSAAFPYARGA